MTRQDPWRKIQLMRSRITLTLLAVMILILGSPVRGVQEDRPAEAANDPKPYVSPPAWESVEIANFYLKRKKYRAALSRYQEAVNTDPYYAPGYWGLGKVYEKIGLRQKALEAYKKYLDTLPSAKQAEEAKEAQRAIARLERRLNRQDVRPKGRASGGDAASHPH